MSHLLHQLCGTARLIECARHQPALRPFIVTIGTKTSARLTFEVMAGSASEAQERHESLAEMCERVEVVPVEVAPADPVDAFRKAGVL